MLKIESECITIYYRIDDTAIQLFKNTGFFYRLECQFRKKLNIINAENFS